MLLGPLDGEPPPAPRALGAEAASRVALLPTDDVPTGFIWPAHSGRATLRALAQGGALRGTVAVDASGVASRTIGDHVFRTSLAGHFADAEGARQALVRAARERTQLGALLVPDTVLVVQPARDGSSWLWTVTPHVPSVADALAAGADADLLRAYGDAVAHALHVAARHGHWVDPAPRAFGVRHGAARYLGDVAAWSSDHPRAADAILAAIDAIAGAGADPAPLVAALERGIPAHLTGDDLARLALGAAFDAASASSPASESARDRLCAAVARVRKAA
jgi:hypothetical protein